MRGVPPQARQRKRTAAVARCPDVVTRRQPGTFPRAISQHKARQCRALCFVELGQGRLMFSVVLPLRVCSAVSLGAMPGALASNLYLPASPATLLKLIVVALAW